MFKSWAWAFFTHERVCWIVFVWSKKSISPAFAFGIFDPIFVSWIFPTSSEEEFMFLKTRNDFISQGAEQLELSLKLIKVSRSTRFSISPEYFRNTKSADCEERREGKTVSPLGAILTSSTPTPHQQPTIFLVGTSTSTPCHTSKLSISNWPNSLSSDSNARRKNVGECKLEIGKCFEESLSDFVNSVLFVDSAMLSLKLCYYLLYYRARTQKKGFQRDVGKARFGDKVKIIEKGLKICFNFEAENCQLDSDMMKSAKIKARMYVSVEIEFSRLIARVSTKWVP